MCDRLFFLNLTHFKDQSKAEKGWIRAGKKHHNECHTRNHLTSVKNIPFGGRDRFPEPLIQIQSRPPLLISSLFRERPISVRATRDSGAGTFAGFDNSRVFFVSSSCVEVRSSGGATGTRTRKRTVRVASALHRVMNRFSTVR